MGLENFKIGQPVKLKLSNYTSFIRFINLDTGMITTAQEHLPYSHLSTFKYTEWIPSRFTKEKHKDVGLIKEYDKKRFEDYYKYGLGEEESKKILNE